MYIAFRVNKKSMEWLYLGHTKYISNMCEPSRNFFFQNQMSITETIAITREIKNYTEIYVIIKNRSLKTPMAITT